ncbi:MAG: hypothetical protein KBA26_07585 [Candidatus Delongbacteria bacterium]|nr:hypothetical protein [Candidatus Delongbacteria bacterium]
MDYMDLLEEKIKSAKSDLKLQQRNLTEAATSGIEWRNLIFNRYTGIGFFMVIFLLFRRKIFRKTLGRIPLISFFFR